MGGLARTLVVSGVVALSGCGAAYYGAAIGIIATQKDTTVTDESFPDAVPTGEVNPAFATLTLTPTQVAIERDLNTFNPSNIAAVTTQAAITDFEVTRISFPPGYGEALSNRDTGTSLAAGDRIVIRINGDTARAIVMDATDVATIGTTVAARIQAKVRALAPVTADVPTTAYTLFTATFDQTTTSYRFRSGSPGEASEVVFEPTARTGKNDAEPNAVSTATARRLGLGTAQGGIETAGADSISVVVLNRGTDSIPQGTTIDVWLSHDKVLDTKIDLPIDKITMDATVAVGEARRFFRRNGLPPVRRLARGDFTAGHWHVLFDVASSGGEKVLTNNRLASTRTVEVHQPVDDPVTPAAETAAVLDIVPVATSSPIAVVMGKAFPTTVTLTNVGAAVAAPGIVTDLDVVLSANPVFDEPAAIRDPGRVLPGLFVNPTDPSSPVRMVVTTGGTSGISVAVSNNNSLISIATDGVATVQSLIDTLNTHATASTLVDAFHDGIGSAPATTVSALITAAGVGANDVIARDILVGTRRVTFAAAAQPLALQSFAIDATVRARALKTILLPRKLAPLVRVRPVGALPGPAPNNQNPRSDVRAAVPFVRVYDPAKATFDSTTGALLPTVNSDDFASLDAVSLRPVNTGSIRQGQQRVFRFELPRTGIANDESQLLVVVRTTNVDLHLDLLNSSGAFIAGSDDTALGRDPVLYVPAQAGASGRSFYLVLSTARADEADLAGGGETFELTISVNARQTGDPALVAAVNAAGIVSQTPRRYADTTTPRVVNRVLIPFSLSQSKAEVGFILPQRARVKFATRPVFTIGVKTTITRFNQGQVPTPIDHQQVLDPNDTRIVYRPTGATLDTSHVLEAGAYTFAFETSGKVPDVQALRLEIDAEFIPPAAN